MNKVHQIISKDFDTRMGLAVCHYLCEQVGIDKAKEITDEQIEGLEGNALMTKAFCQSMVRCARRIARECSFVNDIVPYLIDEWGHLSGHISQERTANILLRYLGNELASGVNRSHIREVLEDVCGCTEDELEDIGVYDWLGFEDYFDEEE